MFNQRNLNSKTGGNWKPTDSKKKKALDLSNEQDHLETQPSQPTYPSLDPYQINQLKNQSTKPGSRLTTVRKDKPNIYTDLARKTRGLSDRAQSKQLPVLGKKIGAQSQEAFFPQTIDSGTYEDENKHHLSSGDSALSSGRPSATSVPMYDKNGLQTPQNQGIQPNLVLQAKQYSAHIQSGRVQSGEKLQSTRPLEPSDGRTTPLTKIKFQPKPLPLTKESIEISYRGKQIDRPLAVELLIVLMQKCITTMEESKIFKQTNLSG